MASRWDAGNWSSGPVTVLGSLGFTRNAKWPPFVPSLAARQAAAGGGSLGSGGISGGGGAAGTSTGGPTSPGQSVGSSRLSGDLSYQQLEQLWVDAGGNPAVRNIAAAVAEAESSGRQNAKNVNTNGSIDRGYWQINSIWGSLSTFDPLANARAAVSISKNGTNWGPWVTFQTGAYRRFLQPLSSQPPVNTPGSNSGTPGVATRSTTGAGNWFVASFGSQHDVYQASSAANAQARHPSWTIAGPFKDKTAADSFAGG